MPIAISGRQVVDSAEFARLTRIARSAPSNLFVARKRSMRQAVAPYLSYEFTFPPSTFTHDGYGVTLNEINRPYSTPVIDITGGKALRASFEFVIADALDGFSLPIDKDLTLLHEIANYGVPVDFDNVHDALATPLWYIDNISFSHTRINADGATTAAQCTMSLVEFRPRSQKMILLPRFKYGDVKPPGKPPKTPPDGGTSPDDVKALADALAANKAAGNTDAARWYALALANANKKD
jgi:hypothetical protein